MRSLSQARLLGGLNRAAPVPFRASWFTSGVHPPDATAQGLIACLDRRWDYPSISASRLVAHQAHALLQGGEALRHVLHVLDNVVGLPAAFQKAGCGAREQQEHARMLP
jgi:hypothetical protein